MVWFWGVLQPRVPHQKHILDQLLNKVLAVFLKNHWLKIRVFCIKFPLKIIKQLVYCLVL